MSSDENLHVEQHGKDYRDGNQQRPSLDQVYPDINEACPYQGGQSHASYTFKRSIPMNEVRRERAVSVI